MDARRQPDKEKQEQRKEERRRRRREARRAREARSIPHPMPPEDMKVEDVRFFALGHGRSGTTWLERTLNTHPEVLCLGSGMFFGRFIQNFGGRRLLYEVLNGSEGLKTWHEWEENLWTKPEDAFDRDVAQIARAAIDALMRRKLTESGKRVLGDRTPHHISHLDEVHALYPDAKIVHAIRDGRDVAISGMHSFWHRAEDRGGVVKLSPEEIETRDAYLNDREGFLAGGGSIFTEERIRQRASGWNRIVRQGRKGRESFGDNYTELFYEEHLHRPHEALTTLFGFLEVDTSPEVIERVVEENTFKKLSAGRSSGEETSGSFFRKGISGDWKGVFTERDKRVFKEEAGELLVELGYEEDLNW